SLPFSNLAFQHIGRTFDINHLQTELLHHHQLPHESPQRRFYRHSDLSVLKEFSAFLATHLVVRIIQQSPSHPSLAFHHLQGFHHACLSQHRVGRCLLYTHDILEPLPVNQTVPLNNLATYLKH